jgi:hypothetical protein
MFGYINRIASAHKGIASGAGFLMGYLAASPLKHPFMALAALATGGEYIKRKREAEAMDAARGAAIASYQGCMAQHGENCEAEAKQAAIRVGFAKMQGRKPGKLRLIFAWLFGAGALACLAAGDGSSAAINAALCAVLAWPSIRALRQD